MHKPLFESFEAFFPYYMSQHRRPETRWLHVAGTAAGLALGAAAVAARRPKLLVLAPAVAYGTAWLSHLIFEHNQPVSFQYPAWSARADFRMVSALALGEEALLPQGLADGETRQLGAFKHRTSQRTPDLPEAAMI